LVQGEPEAPLKTDEQLNACHRSGYVEIGSHGLAHQHLPQLTEAQVREEVVNSIFPLESLIDDEVVSFAYPYGDYGNREVNLVREAGYIFGIGTINGPLSMSADLMRVRRINMFPNTRPAKFWRKTSGFYLRYCRIKGKDF
jgi:peptidoglycan/xylan/chitin deacetylase (PgdA/CDA1 family)